MEKVENKIMYHFHKPFVEPDMWQVDNEIVVDNNFKSYFTYNSIYQNPVKKLHLSNSTDEYDGYFSVADYLLEKATDENLLLLSKNEKDYLEKMKYIKYVLRESFGIIHRTAISNREQGLEDYRIQNTPELPSRLHSLWVCTNEQLNYWKKKLDIESELYVLALTGNLFRTNDSFLPSIYLSREDAKKYADKYWNPPVERDEQRDEYLFQGKALILRKVFI